MLKVPCELKAYWDQRLKESGFKDIEIEINGERLLEKSANPHLKTAAVISDSKIAYYRAVSRKTSIHEFASELERQIMIAYSEGVSQAEIKRRMEDIGIKMHRETLYEMIYQYLGLWGIKPYYKKWAPKRKP